MVGGRPGLAVGPWTLVTREYLTNSRSAGLGCAVVVVMEDSYRHDMNCERHCYYQSNSHAQLYTTFVCAHIHTAKPSIGILAQPASTNGRCDLPPVSFKLQPVARRGHSASQPTLPPPLFCPAFAFSLIELEILLTVQRRCVRRIYRTADEFPSYPSDIRQVSLPPSHYCMRQTRDKIHASTSRQDKRPVLSSKVVPSFARAVTLPTKRKVES